MQNHGQFSIIPARAIYDTRLNPDDRDVLGCLGLYADRDGWCYPNQKTIGKILGKSRSFISNRISHLEKCGYVTVVEQHDPATNARIGNKYRVIHDAELPIEFDRSLEEDTNYETDTPVLEHEEMETTPVLKRARIEIAKRLIERPNFPSEKTSDGISPISFSEKPGKNGQYKRMLGVLANVTRTNPKLQGAKLGISASRLIRAGYDPDQVQKVFGQGGAYWKKDWRGKKGDIPTIATINDSIARLLKENEKSEVMEV